MGEYETTTRTGRVVYTRRRHYFKPQDLLRIYESIRINYPPIEISQEDLSKLKTIRDSITEIYFPVVEDEEKEELHSRYAPGFEGMIQKLSVNMLEELFYHFGIRALTYEKSAEDFYWLVWNSLDKLISRRKE